MVLSCFIMLIVEILFTCLFYTDILYGCCFLLFSFVWNIVRNFVRYASLFFWNLRSWKNFIIMFGRTRLIDFCWAWYTLNFLEGLAGLWQEWDVLANCEFFVFKVVGLMRQWIIMDVRRAVILGMSKWRFMVFCVFWLRVSILSEGDEMLVRLGLGSKHVLHRTDSIGVFYLSVWYDDVNDSHPPNCWGEGLSKKVSVCRFNKAAFVCWRSFHNCVVRWVIAKKTFGWSAAERLLWSPAFIILVFRCLWWRYLAVVSGKDCLGSKG